MVISDVLKNLDENSPPFQPFISTPNIKMYKEKRIKWNPFCVKKDALFYQFITGDKGNNVELLPDACVNILFECDASHPQALFSGTFVCSKSLQLKPNTQYFGVKPYTTLGLRFPKTCPRELVGNAENFTYVFPDSSALLEQISAAQDFNQRIALFNRFSAKHFLNPDYTPSFIDYFTIMICSAKGNLLFQNLKSSIGYSERYCREKFKDSYGISPKTYSSIMRFQNVLKSLVAEAHPDLMTLTQNNAYFDQAHFIHDFKKYASVSPNKFRKKLGELECCNE